MPLQREHAEARDAGRLLVVGSRFVSKKM